MLASHIFKVRSVEPLMIVLFLIWEAHTPPVCPVSVRKHCAWEEWVENSGENRYIFILAEAETLARVHARVSSCYWCLSWRTHTRTHRSWWWLVLLINYKYILSSLLLLFLLWLLFARQHSWSRNEVESAFSPRCCCSAAATNRFRGLENNESAKYCCCYWPNASLTHA